MAKKVLLAGESWMSYTTHVKGFDSFYTSVLKREDMSLHFFQIIWQQKNFLSAWKN